MPVISVRLLPAFVGALGIALGLSAILVGQTGAEASRTGGNASKGEAEWRFFGSDTGATRYSSANQIDASNVQSLSVAWRFSTRNLGPRPATGMQVSISQSPHQTSRLRSTGFVANLNTAHTWRNRSRVFLNA